MRLIIQNTHLDKALFHDLIRVSCTQLSYLRFEGCQIEIDSGSGQDTADKCKTIVFKQCKIIGNLEFIHVFPNLSTFEVEDSQVNDFEGLLNTIRKSKYVTRLALKTVISTSADLISLVGYIETNRLESLDLSGSVLSNSDLEMLNQVFEHVTIKELVIQNIKLDAEYDMSKFLSKTVSLRKLSVAASNITQINQLIVSLGSNKSVNSFELVCEADYSNLNLDPLKLNDELESFQFSYRLPLWLISKLEENSRHKLARQSTIIDVNEGITEIAHLNSKNKQDCFKIGLSLDGGGMRGLMLAAELQYLCR